MALSVNLDKGDSKALIGAHAVKNAYIGLGWDENQGQSNYDLDPDVFVLCVDANGDGQVIAYFNNLNPEPWVRHHGDNRTGKGEGDDEAIDLLLDQVPANIRQIHVGVCIYEGEARGQDFAYLENAFCRVVNKDTDNELVKTVLSGTDFMGFTGLHVASFRRIGTGQAWEFVAVQVAKPEYKDISTFASQRILV